MTSRSPNKVTALTWLSTALAASHLTLVYATGRLRWDHAAVDALLLGVAWAGPRLQRFLRGGLALWLTGMLLDSQGLWLFLRGPIHTGDLWELERQLFPAPGGTHWPDWWATRFNTALDLLCGFAYAAYLYEVFVLALFFFVKKDSLFERLCWGFLVANAMGVVIYVLYPAAPPWYVLQYGPGPADLAAPPNPAGTARFDELLGIRYFASFYARSTNVFGAMPSLHAAYPFLVMLFVWSRGWAWRIATGLFALLVAFSAVYLTHHYVLDVLAGLGVAAVAYLAVESVYARMTASAPWAVPLTTRGDTRA
ncbi:phosphatase PAP2 family protein [Corallococcus macrosporus]|uniref:Phosphatidic acid phosphatase n=1 Tax=Corallococcus macrosporus DSM 14697 TaxID=1189310 RepID=A0A250JLY8_9BACT|nr:phosphatase PAP2 family protein [Corallococcus macrosporus]ATB44909.1 phosphatidic acid phosphatase [Corallococcus macrosporus DSM 14697]